MSSYEQLKAVLSSYADSSDQTLDFEDNYCALTDAQGNTSKHFWSSTSIERTAFLATINPHHH